MQISPLKARILKNVPFAVGALFYSYYTSDYKKAKYYESQFNQLSESNLEKIWPIFCDACKKCDYDPQNLRLVSWDKVNFQTFKGKRKQDPGVLCVPDAYFNNFDSIFNVENRNKLTIKLVRQYDKISKNSINITDEELLFMLMVEIERLKSIKKEWTSYLIFINGLIAFNITLTFVDIWVYHALISCTTMLLTDVASEYLQARRIDRNLMTHYFDPLTAYTSIDCQRQIIKRLDIVDPDAYMNLPTHDRKWFLDSRSKSINLD